MLRFQMHIIRVNATDTYYCNLVDVPLIQFTNIRCALVCRILVLLWHTKINVSTSDVSEIYFANNRLMSRIMAVNNLVIQHNIHIKVHSTTWEMCRNRVNQLCLVVVERVSDAARFIFLLVIERSSMSSNLKGNRYFDQAIMFSKTIFHVDFNWWWNRNWVANHLLPSNSFVTILWNHSRCYGETENYTFSKAVIGCVCLVQSLLFIDAIKL